jgi:hypothetical protein
MASVPECEAAFQELAHRLTSVDADTRKRAAFDRTVSCTLRDLDVIFAARLSDGDLHDITQVTSPEAQLRLAVTSDDLVALTDGSLSFSKAWTSGRLRIEASVFDLLKLRSFL